MKIKLSSEVTKKIPNIKNGFILIRGLNNFGKSNEPYALCKQSWQERGHKIENIEEKEIIKSWHECLESVEIDYQKYPPSIEYFLSLIKQKKPAPHINPVVDLYNSVSIKYLVPMGGYDISQIKGDIEISCLSKKTEFTPLAKKTPIILKAGEIVLQDQHNVLCAKMVWKQNESAALSDRSRNILIRIEATCCKTNLEELMDEVGQLITKHCGGNFSSYILSADHPEIDLSVIIKEINQYKYDPKEEAIYNLINKGTVDIVKRKDLEDKLRSGRKLKIKLGIDPTGSDLHIGHMVTVRKLSEFQKLGHQIQLLFGNFTGQIGDPTGKSKVRTTVTQEILDKNAETYQKQVAKVLDINQVEVVWNADWLAKLNFDDVVRLTSLFTVPQMLERDMFKERMAKKIPIYVHEFMYPLMQGYDSVALESDVEVGGTDQTFNLLAGRTLQKAHGQVAQEVVTVPILEGLDGHIKMSKTENNYVGVLEAPSEQFGKIMSIPDDLILKYFELASNLTLDEIKIIKSELSAGVNPRDVKMRLAREIIAIYWSETEAKEAQESFKNVFQKKQIPDNIVEIILNRDISIIEVMANNNMSASKGDARRLIKQQAVSFNNKKVSTENFKIMESGVLKVGKRRFLKIKIN